MQDQDMSQDNLENQTSDNEPSQSVTGPQEPITIASASVEIGGYKLHDTAQRRTRRLQPSHRSHRIQKTRPVPVHVKRVLDDLPPELIERVMKDLVSDNPAETHDNLSNFRLSHRYANGVAQESGALSEFGEKLNFAGRQANAAFNSLYPQDGLPQSIVSVTGEDDDLYENHAGKIIEDIGPSLRFRSQKDNHKIVTDIENLTNPAIRAEAIASMMHADPNITLDDRKVLLDTVIDDLPKLASGAYEADEDYENHIENYNFDVTDDGTTHAGDCAIRAVAAGHEHLLPSQLERFDLAIEAAGQSYRALYEQRKSDYRSGKYDNYDFDVSSEAMDGFEEELRDMQTAEDIVSAECRAELVYDVAAQARGAFDDAREKLLSPGYDVDSYDARDRERSSRVR